MERENMKLLILSDSHGMTTELLEIYEYHKTKVDFFLHCGDSQLQFNSSFLQPYIKVTGNCDFDIHHTADYPSSSGHP